MFTSASKVLQKVKKNGSHLIAAADFFDLFYIITLILFAYVNNIVYICIIKQMI